jgi:hypothetical protein
VSVYVAHRSHDIEEVIVKDVLKDFQDNKIYFIQVQHLGQITVSKQNCQQKKKVPQRDTGVGNGRQSSEIFKNSGKINIFFVCNML